MVAEQINPKIYKSCTTHHTTRNQKTIQGNRKSNNPREHNNVIGVHGEPLRMYKKKLNSRKQAKGEEVALRYPDKEAITLQSHVQKECREKIERPVIQRSEDIGCTPVTGQTDIPIENTRNPVYLNNDWQTHESTLIKDTSGEQISVIMSIAVWTHDRHLLKQVAIRK